MKLDCNSMTLKELFSKRVFVIPRYQRPYSWTTPQIKELIADILSANDAENGHFIGSMVFIENKPKKDIAHLEVIDGQQRLTTLVLLLVALRDGLLTRRERAGISSDELAEVELLCGSIEDNFHVAEVELGRIFVLDHRSCLDFFVENIVRRPENRSLSSKSHGYSNEEEGLKRGYRDCLRELDEKASTASAENGTYVDSIRKILDLILGAQLISITMENREDAYLVFQTLNTRGIDLKQADLIKSHILRLLPIGDQADTGNNLWKNLVSIVGDDSFDEFLHYSWESRYEKTPRPKLFAKVSNKVNSENVVEFLKDLEFDARLYNLIQNPELLGDSGMPFKNLHSTPFLKLQESLNAFKLFKGKQFYPWVLAVLRYLHRNIGAPSSRSGSKFATQALRDIENFYFCYLLVAKERTNRISKLFQPYALRLEGGENPGDILTSLRGKLKDLMPTDEKFINGFKEIQYDKANSRIISYILKGLMVHKGVKLTATREQPTIEHLFPRSKASELGVPETVDMLGNLILLTEQENQAVGNFERDDKVKYFDSNKIWYPESFKKALEWRESEIIDQTEKWAKLAFSEIWSIK